MNLEVKGCGCRYRDQECEHLCYEHMTEFILKLYNNHDKKTEERMKRMIDSHRKGYEEWLKVTNEMNDEFMKDKRWRC